MRDVLAIGVAVFLAAGCGRIGFEPMLRQNDAGTPEREFDAAVVIDAAGAAVDAAVGLDASTLCTNGVPPFGCLDQSFGLRFNGLQRLEIPHAPELNLGTGSSTTEAWIRADVAGPATHTVLSKRDVGDITSGFMFGLLLGGGVWIQYAGAPNHFSNTPNLLDDQWHHIAAVRELLTPTSGEIRLYVDGVIVLRTVVGALRDADTTSSVLIGADANTSPAFAGVIHNVRMWSVARTEAEIEASRFLPLTGAELGLRGAWALDEGVGQTVLDALDANPGNLGDDSGADTSDPLWVAVP